MKKKILFNSIFVLSCVLFLSTHIINGAETDQSKDKYVAAKSGLNLRSTPDKSSKIITLIPFGTKVTIEKSDGKEIFLDGRYGKWVNVKYDNKTGWVFSGFLCDFKPDTVIKHVADFYRKKNSNSDNEYISKNNGLTHFKDSQVSLESIFDNYIVLKVPLTLMDGDPYQLAVVWKYNIKHKKFFEILETMGHKADIFYLDNDRYPDLVVDNSCCTSFIIDFYLGSENGFIKLPDFCGDYTCEDGLSYYTAGLCGDMEFACSGTKYDHKTGKTDDAIMFYYRFNCKTKKFEKYAEGKVSRSDGNIVSVDLKNMSIVIEEEKEKSYNFSDKTYVFYNRSNKDIKVKDLKKGDKVEFYYVTIGSKKTILSMRVYD
ncbi:MAG: SH3 domain-containing protein [Spirochaetes bacterium]|nr:SH3 domain-containing protein [Spirochaetota bacterium]